MLGLPQSTEVNRALPKTQLYRQFDWKPSQRESFDSDVARLDFVNWISPRTLPAITEGSEVKEIFVVEVTLKKRDFDIRNVTLLAKSIPQKIVYLLRYENEVRLAVWHSRLFVTPWMNRQAATLPIDGLNFDAVWQKIVSSIGQFTVDVNWEKSFEEQLKENVFKLKILRQIVALENKMRSISQPRRQREIYAEIKNLKLKLENGKTENAEL
jgi:hypothetical protein